FVNGRLNVVKPGENFRTRPALLKAEEDPPEKDLALWISKMAPSRFRKTAPLSAARYPFPVQVAVPALSNRRPSRCLIEVPLRAMPPLASVRPVPLMMPSVQVNSPVIVRSPEPVTVPARENAAARAA